MCSVHRNWIYSKIILWIKPHKGRTRRAPARWDPHGNHYKSQKVSVKHIPIGNLFCLEAADLLVVLIFKCLVICLPSEHLQCCSSSKTHKQIFWLQKIWLSNHYVLNWRRFGRLFGRKISQTFGQMNCSNLQLPAFHHLWCKKNPKVPISTIQGFWTVIHSTKKSLPAACRSLRTWRWRRCATSGP